MRRTPLTELPMRRFLATTLSALAALVPLSTAPDANSPVFFAMTSRHARYTRRQQG